MIALTYHEDYNKYDLGLDHPLVGNKPAKTMQYFKEKSILESVEVFEAKKAAEDDLLRVHTKQYVERVKELSKVGGMLSFDTPAPIGIFEYASLATGGSLLATEKLFDKFNIAVNPLGGFHHASRNFSSGFCFFNDVAVAVEYLKDKYDLEKIMIIDLDVHHGNGTQEIYFDDPSVLNISFHQDGRTLYPGTGFLDKIGRDSGEGFTINLPLPPKSTNKSYLYSFDKIIPELSRQFKPELIIYQSGVDTHHSDPLADINLTFQAYYVFAKKIKEISKESCDKLLVLFGGGYNSDASVKSYYNIMCGFLDRAEYIKEKEISDNGFETVKKSVEQLENILSPYWDL